MANPDSAIKDFLKPLEVDLNKLSSLSSSLSEVYKQLAAEAEDQFLSCPISVLPSGAEEGRYVEATADVAYSHLSLKGLNLLRPSSFSI
jgi:hypothetical protein